MAAPKGLGWRVAEEVRNRVGLGGNDGLMGGQVLGTVAPDSEITDTTLKPTETTWEGDAGTISMAEPPPPWEIDEKLDLALSDAKRFVEVPSNWCLRWINPRLLDQFGWRDWKPVMVSDPSVKVRVETMVSPEGNIRRGGATGDILAWMYRSWVESRRRQMLKQSAELADSSVRKQDELREDFASGKFGPNIRLEGAKHPTHTMADGRSMRD
jgi:hypothetical protein